MKIEATYSPEDNKLRLYASQRLDDETFQRIKAAGFRWAPKQELFVAPAWSCEREDLCTELAGDIEPEGTSLEARALMKAERLEALAEKRAHQANAYSRAAQDVASRFAGGQPILVGHHSERRARKDAARADALQSKACRAADAVDYWTYRAAGVERNVSWKQSRRTRENRIKTLLSELRGLQRRRNDAERRAAIWLEAANTAHPEAITALASAYEMRVKAEDRARLERGDIPPVDFARERAAAAEATANGPKLQRWIEHTLNRLAYERSELGDVARYEGPFRPAVLTVFAREHGAEDVTATREGDMWTLASTVPLPRHIADGNTLTLTEDAWRDVMRDCGHEAKDKAPAKPPILNIRADEMRYLNPYYRGEIIRLRQVEATRAEYGKVPNDFRGVKLSACGRYRFRIAFGRYFSDGGKHGHDYVAVYLKDQKAHDMPEGVNDAA